VDGTREPIIGKAAFAGLLCFKKEDVKTMGKRLL